MVSAGFIAILAAVSLLVAFGLYRKKNMWAWIAAYWIILAAKNLIEYLTALR